MPPQTFLLPYVGVKCVYVREESSISFHFPDKDNSACALSVTLVKTHYKNQIISVPCNAVSMKCFCKSSYYKCPNHSHDLKYFRATYLQSQLGRKVISLCSGRICFTVLWLLILNEQNYYPLFFLITGVRPKPFPLFSWRKNKKTI